VRLPETLPDANPPMPFVTSHSRRSATRKSHATSQPKFTARGRVTPSPGAEDSFAETWSGMPIALVPSKGIIGRAFAATRHRALPPSAKQTDCEEGLAMTQIRKWHFAATAALLVALTAGVTPARRTNDSPRPTPMPAQDAKGVLYFDKATVAAAFAKGGAILPREDRNFSILAARREKTGQAEVHTKDTDIFYVLEGEATLITGGTVVESKETAADEIRGASIQGGQTRHLVKGDVIVIPAGVPHWMSEVTNPFLYFVVKVR
jgi:quercetin dioxygenase-like cupin family protein